MDMSERDAQDKGRTIVRKLQALSGQTNTVILTLRAEIKEKCALLAAEMREYLQKPQVKYLLCSAWKDGEIPELSEEVKSPSHWCWVKERVDLAFFVRLGNILDNWGEENCDIMAIESKVVEDIRAKLGVLEEEICEMEHFMHTSSVSSGSGSDEEPGRRSGGKPGSSRRISLRAFNSGGTLVDEPTKVDLKVMLGFKSKPASENILSKARTLRKSKLFTKNPQCWARERAEKLLKKLTNGKDGKKLETLVIQLLQRPIEYIDLVEVKVPGLLKANEQLLQSIESARLNEKKNVATFETMMKEIENLRTHLKNYGEGYIFVDDFKSNEVKLVQTLLSGESLAKTFPNKVKDLVEGDKGLSSGGAAPRGLWSVVSQGILKRGDKEQSISIRFYLPSSGVDNTFAEVAKLR